MWIEFDRDHDQNLWAKWGVPKKNATHQEWEQMCVCVCVAFLVRQQFVWFELCLGDADKCNLNLDFLSLSLKSWTSIAYGD